MTEPVVLQGPSPVAGVQAPAATQPPAAGSLISPATLGLAPSSLDDTLDSYELFVPGDVRQAISQITDREQRLAVQREAINFFSGETIYRYTAGGQPYAGKKITAQITLDNGQKAFLYVDQAVPRFNALYLLFRHGLTELSATAMVRQTNLAESIRKYLDWRKTELLSSLQKLKSASQENRDVLLSDLRSKVRGLAEQLQIDVSALNLDTVEGIEAAVNLVSQRLTNVSDADLTQVGAAVLAADSGASRDEIKSFLVLLSQDRLRIGFKTFGDKLYQLNRQSVSVNAGEAGQVGGLSFQAYVWNEQPVQELSPFLKILSQIMFPEIQNVTLDSLCGKINAPSRHGNLDRDMFLTRVDGSLVGDIDGTARPALQVYYHVSNVPGESLDYVVATGDLLIVQGIDGMMTTGTADTRYEHINELLQLAGAPGTDFATRAISFYNQHATEIYDVENEIDQNTINLSQNAAFNAYLKTSLTDRASTLSMVERALQFSQVEDLEERALLFVVLAAIQMGKDPVLGNFQVTANGQELTGISQESLQYIIDQVHQFYTEGGTIDGQQVAPLSGRKDMIRKGFARFDRQAPAVNSEYMAILVLAKHIAQNVQTGSVDLNQVSSAAGLSVYGTGNRQSPVANRQVIIQELSFIRDQLSFQGENVVPLLGGSYQEIEINTRFLEILQRIASERSIQRNVPFYSVLETSSLYRLAQVYDPKIMDPLWILVQYIEKLASGNRLAISAEAVTQMEAFLLGQEPLSASNLQVLLGVLNAPINIPVLQQALDDIGNHANFDQLTPVWQKLISGEWSLNVDQQADGDLILPEDPNAPVQSMPAAGVTVLGSVPDPDNNWLDIIGAAFSNPGPDVDINALKDERVANLWLLVFDRNPESIPVEERALFTAAGVEIPAGIGPEARQAFLSGLHRVPAYLSASALRGLVNILNERYIAYSPVNFTGYNALKRLFDGQLTIEGLTLSEADRALIRRILLMKSEEENVYNRILSGADRQAVIELLQTFNSASLICSDPQVLEDIRNALQIFASQDNLVIINQPVEGLNELLTFTQKLESGYFTVNGRALHGVAELEVPEGVTHADEYLRYINILKAISDSLTSATYIEPKPVTNFLDIVANGMHESLMGNDPEAYLSAIPQGMVRDFKVMMYFDSLQDLNSTQNSDISQGNNLIEARNALLLNREDLLLRKSQGEDVEDWLAENTRDLQAVAEQFRELLGLDHNDQYSEVDGVTGIIDRIPSISDPRNIGLYLAYLRIISTGLSALADIKEIQKEADFNAGVLQYLSAHYNNDLSKLDEARQAYYQSDAYRRLDEQFQNSIRPLNELRDNYEMEYNALTRYVNSDEIDDRFMNTFLSLFAGDRQSDFGMFEWNYSVEAAASGTHVIFKDENGREISNAQELYAFLNRIFGQVSGGHWTSISRLPSDTNLAVVKAKQVMAYLLMNLPVNQVQVNTLNASLNVAASLLQQHAHNLHFRGSWVTSILTNPIFIGGVEWAAEELGVGSTSSVGPTSLETLQYYVNSASGRHEYQIAQIAQGISLPDTSWRQNIGGMAGLIFGNGIDFDLGQSGFDRASQIDADLVENAIESFLRIRQDINASPANRALLQGLIDEEKVTIPLDDLTLNALQALMNYLRSHRDLHVNLFDPLNAASALDGRPDVNGAVKLGLMRLAQLTLEISEIESKIYPQQLVTSEDQQLNPLMGHAPGQILRRYIIEGEGSDREISIIRIDPADPNRKIIVKFRPATFGETFHGWLENVGQGFADFADTITESQGTAEEIGNAFYTGLVEGANFRFMIPINIFAGFANDTIKAAKAYIGLMAKAEQTSDPYEKALYLAMAEMMKKRFKESIGRTYGSFLGFERDPRAILGQLYYFATHGQLGRAVGYSIIALPFAMGIMRGNFAFLGEFANFFRGRPVEYARWNQYGLASFPMGVTQKILFEISKRGWNNNLITRAVDTALSSAGARISDSRAGSVGRLGLRVYRVLFQNPVVRTAVNFFNVHLGGMSDMARVEGDQGFISQVGSLRSMTRIMWRRLKKVFLQEVRAYYEAQGLTGDALKQAVNQAWQEFKQVLQDPDLQARLGLELQPLDARSQLAQFQNSMFSTYSEIVNRASVDLLLKKIFDNNVPAEYSWVSDNLYQLLSDAEALESRIRSAEAMGMPHSQLEVLKAQRAEIQGRLNDLIEQARQQIGAGDLADKFERTLRNNLNRETFVLNADVKIKAANQSAVRHEIKARLMEIRNNFFNNLVPNVQEMAQRFMGALEGPAGPSGSGPSGSSPSGSRPNNPFELDPSRAAAPDQSAAPQMGTPHDILSGLVNGPLGEQFNDILPERLAEFKALLEAKGVKVEINENLGRLTEADLMNLRTAVEALEATSGRTYRLVLNENGFALVYKAEANVDVMVARGSFTANPTGDGRGQPMAVPESTPILSLGGIQPTAAPAAPEASAIDGNLALQPEIAPNPYDPISQSGITVGRDGFTGLSTEAATDFANELVSRKVQFITVAEGVTLTEADITSLLSKIPTGNPRGANVPGLGRPTGRAIIVLGPDLVYSVSLYQGMTIEQNGNTFRFMLNGEAISTYELRGGFEMVQLEATDINLNSRLEVDINRQVEKIAKNIGDLANTAWEAVLDQLVSENGPEFLKTEKGRELLRYIEENRGGLSRGARGAVSFVAGGLQILGMEWLADQIGIENPSLRFLFTMGGLQLLTPATQAIIAGRVSLQTLGRLANETFFTAQGWVNLLEGVGSAVVAGQIYSGALRALHLENTFMNNEFFTLGAAMGLPVAMSKLTAWALEKIGASAGTRLLFSTLGGRVIPLIGWVSLAETLGFYTIAGAFDAESNVEMINLVAAEAARRHPELGGFDGWDVLGFFTPDAVENSLRLDSNISTEEFKEIQSEILEQYHTTSNNLSENLTQNLVSSALNPLISQMTDYEGNVNYQGEAMDYAFFTDIQAMRQALAARIDELFPILYPSNGMDDDLDSGESAYDEVNLSEEAAAVRENIVQMKKMLVLIKENSNTIDTRDLEEFLSYFDRSGNLIGRTQFINMILAKSQVQALELINMRVNLRMAYLLLNPGDANYVDAALGLVYEVGSTLAGYEGGYTYEINASAPEYSTAIDMIKGSMGDQIKKRMVDLMILALQNNGTVPADRVDQLDVALGLVWENGVLNQDSEFYHDAVITARSDERLAFRMAQLIQTLMSKTMNAQMVGIPPLENCEFTQLDLDLHFVNGDFSLNTRHELFNKAMDGLKTAWQEAYQNMSETDQVRQRAILRLLYVKSAKSPIIRKILEAYGDQAFLTWVNNSTHEAQLLEYVEQLANVMSANYMVYGEGDEDQELNPAAQALMFEALIQKIANINISQ